MVNGNDSYPQKFTRFYVNNSLWNIPFFISLASALKKNKSVFIFVTEPFLKFNERYELKVFRNLVRKGMTVLDIGANIGLYTLVASRAVGQHGKVISFEPDPFGFEILSHRINGNGHKNVTLVNKALSNTNGFTRLYIDRFNQGNHSFSKDNLYIVDKHIKVPTTTLDKYFNSKNGVKNIDIIKIDVQGAEGLVFEGAKNLLRNGNVKILMEFWPSGMKRLKSNPMHALTTLSEYGFKYSILDKKSKTMAPVGLNELMTIVDKWSNESDYTNLLLQKKP